MVANDDDAWHKAQNEWHEKLREAFGYDELTPPGISDRRKEWQTATKTAAAFRKKLAEDPTLAHPREDMNVDDGTTRNERRAEQRREQKAREIQRRTQQHARFAKKAPAHLAGTMTWRPCLVVGEPIPEGQIVDVVVAQRKRKIDHAEVTVPEAEEPLPAFPWRSHSMSQARCGAR